MNKIYFPNLNGLRFTAALLVIIYHVEAFKYLMGFPNHHSNPFLYLIGELGVILFFVLSGFLITYLLLAEEKKTGTVSIKDFYIRRILRIWPLYFGLIVICFFIFPRFSFFNISQSLLYSFGIKLTLFLVLLPNLAETLFGIVTPYGTQAWSVGVEEQFYLLWPLLMKKVKNKERLFYFIIGGYLFIKIIVFGLIRTFMPWTELLEKVWHFFYITSIDCMAIGGIFALYLFREDKILPFLFNRAVQIITLITLCTLIGFGIKIPYIHFEYYSVLFGIIILNLAGNPKAVISLENKVFNYLGKISYGLYMYHAIAIIVSIKVLILLGLNNLFLQYFCSIGITILVAGLSYKFYESYFINLKVKFSKIISGDNAGRKN